MLKTISKVTIAILISIVIALSSSSSLAVETQEESVTESTETTETAPETEASTEENITEEEAEAAAEEQAESGANTTKESDVYLIETGTVTVDYTVDGNLFIIADTVNITSQIGGDAFIIANNINIDGGYIYNNLFAVATNINVNGIVYDIYTCTDNLTIGASGYIYRDAHIMTNKFNVLGPIGRNVSAILNNIAFTSEDTNATGKIFGTLNYTSENEINIDKNYVEGDINFNKSVAEPTATTVETYLYSVAMFVIMALVIYLLTIWLTPKFAEEAKETLTKKPLQTIGFGLLALFAIPLLVLLLLILQVTVSVAFALLALYVLLLLIASAYFVIAVAEAITEKIKMENKWQKLGIVVCIAVVLWAIGQIPYVGGFIEFVAIILGLGILTKKIIPHKNKKIEESVEKEIKPELKEAQQEEANNENKEDNNNNN